MSLSSGDWPTGGGTSARLWGVTYAQGQVDDATYSKGCPKSAITDGDWLVVGDDAHPVTVEHGDYLAAQNVGIARTCHGIWQTPKPGATFHGWDNHDFYYYEYIAHFHTGAITTGTLDVRARMEPSLGPSLRVGSLSPGDYFTDPAGHVYPFGNVPPGGTGTGNTGSWVTVAPNSDITVYARIEVGGPGQVPIAPPPTVTFHIDGRYAEAGTPTLWERQAGVWVQQSDQSPLDHVVLHALDPPKPLAHHARMWVDPPGAWRSIGESAVFDGSNWIRP